MNKYYSRLSSCVYLPMITRGKSNIFILLPIFALCLSCITPHVFAEQSANKDSEPVQKELTAIKVADISERAGEIEDRIQKVKTDLFETEMEKQATEDLEKLKDEVKILVSNIESTLSTRFGKNEIQALQLTSKNLKKRLTTLQEQFKKRAEKLSNGIEIVQDETKIWRLTQKEVQRESAPVTVKKRVKEVLSFLHKAQVKAKKHRNSALDILARTAKLQDQVDALINRIEDAESKQVSNVFEAQDLPLWQTWSDTEQIKAIPDSTTRRVIELKTGLIRYIREQQIPLLIQTIFTLLLGWFLSRRYWLIREEVKAENYGLDALKHPWYAAMLFSLYMTPFVYTDRTLGFILVTIIISLPLWLSVVSGMLPAAFRITLITAALLALIEEFRSVFGGFTVLTRWTLMVEFVVALVILRWLLRSKHFQQIPSYLRSSFWYKFTLTWLRYSILVLGVGILAVLFGYSELANRIAMLVIWGPVAGASFIAIVRIVEAVLKSYIEAGQFDFLNMIRVNRHPFVILMRRILRALGFFAWAFLILRVIQLLEPIREVLYMILTAQLGVDPVKFSLGSVIAFIFTLWFSWLLARFVNLLLNDEIFSRLRTPPGVPFAITTFSRYTILVIGFLAAVSVLGFPLDKITIVLGALGVGIGFGLQNITNNFVSGIILLFERPIRVGDKIQLDDLIGKVTSIGIRACKITSFEGSDVIVPNADFISSRVINWTFSDEKRRVVLPVGVAHGTDPEQVLSLLLKVAGDHPEIIDSPVPEALFQKFGESSLEFELRVWTESNRGWVAVKSDLAVAIHKALQEAHIEIPLPRRDVNLRNIPELREALASKIK